MTAASTDTPTGEAVQRRKLWFYTIDDALADAERLVAAEAAGRLEHVGNWTLGQALNHLATWADFAFDGYPASVHAPLPVRLILRVMWNRILSKGMMAGVRVGKVPGGTLGAEVVATADAMTRFRSAFERLRGSAPTVVNPVFGRLTHGQWIQLNLRHAELHLSFQIPQISTSTV